LGLNSRFLHSVGPPLSVIIVGCGVTDFVDQQGCQMVAANPVPNADLLPISVAPTHRPIKFIGPRKPPFAFPIPRGKECGADEFALLVEIVHG